MRRRDFFKIGGLSVGAISPLGLSLSEVLAMEASSSGKKQINVIFMFLQDGASHLDMYGLEFEAGMAFIKRYTDAMEWQP